MAAKVDIVVDISKLRDAIAQAQQDVASLKVNGQQVTIGGKRIDAQINKTNNEVKKLNKTVQQTGQTAQQSTQKALTGLKAMTSQAKQAVGYVKSFAQSLITPWTFLIIAVEAASKTFQYFWSNLTENIDKATARGQSAIKSAQRQIKKTEQRTKTVNDLIKQLDELNKLEDVSDEQRAVGASIINRLNKEYKVFGITLDEVTGKYQGLYQAQMIVDARNREIEAANIRKQIQGQRQVVNATIKDVLGGNIELGKSINGSDLTNWAERLGGTLLAQNANLLANKWGKGNDLYAIRDVFQQMMDGLSDRQNVAQLQKIIDEVNELIDYYQQLNNVNSISRTAADSAKRLADSFEEQRKAIKDTREEIEKLNQQYQQGQKQSEFDALSPKEKVKALQEEIKALEERNQAIGDLKNSNQQKIDQSRFKADNLRILKEENFAQQQALQEQVDARVEANRVAEKKISVYSNSQRLKDLEEQKKPIQSQLDFIDRKIESSKSYNNGAYQISDKELEKRSKLLDQLKPINDQIDKIYGKIKSAKDEIALNDQLNLADQKQIDALEASVKQLEIDAKNFGDAAYGAEQEVVDIQLERAKNQNEIVNKKKQQAELTKQIAEAEAKAAEEARQRQIQNLNRSMNVQDTLRDIADKGQIELLKKQGKNIEAQALEREKIIEDLTKRIETQLGRPLGEKDQAIREQIAAGADIQMALKGLNTDKPQLQNDQVYSNELARMGGFSSSIVVDRMDINKELLNVNKQANNNLNTIANSVQKIYDNTTL